jgi:hypothetical protein
LIKSREEAGGRREKREENRKDLDVFLDLVLVKGVRFSTRSRSKSRPRSKSKQLQFFPPSFKISSVYSVLSVRDSFCLFYTPHTIFLNLEP